MEKSNETVWQWSAQLTVHFSFISKLNHQLTCLTVYKEMYKYMVWYFFELVTTEGFYFNILAILLFGCHLLLLLFQVFLIKVKFESLE